MKIVAVTLVACTALTAQANDWIPLSETESNTWEGRAGTRVEAQTRNGTPVIKAAGRILDRRSQTYQFVQWYVSIDDCKQGFGKLVTLDMSGNFRFDNDYVEKGGSVASTLAAMLCVPVKEAQGRGI